MELYFNQIGGLDDNGNYVIKDYELLVEVAESGDIYAQDLLLIHDSRANQIKSNAGAFGIESFAMCIARDYFGVYYDLINGNLWEAFKGYVAGKAWDKAAGILVKFLGLSPGWATAGQVAVAAYNCRNAW